MSKAREKGTRGENFFMEELLRPIWPTVERAPLKGINDAGDFVNVPIPVESKNTKRPLFPGWVEVLRRKSPDHRWLLCWKGDARGIAGKPVVVMDLEFAKELLEHFYVPKAEAG